MGLKKLQIFLVLMLVIFSFMIGSQGSCGTVTYEYDHLNRVIKSENQGAYIMEYDYDEAGNRTFVATDVESIGYDPDADNDVDGLDLQAFASGAHAFGTELSNFANVFGTQN